MRRLGNTQVGLNEAARAGGFVQTPFDSVPERAPLPTVILRHQPPKTIRPNSSPKRFAISGSFASRNRSASSKNSCCCRPSISMPFSINSTNIRVALSFRVFAIARSCVATWTGRLTVWHTVFCSAPIARLCTVNAGLEPTRRADVSHPADVRLTLPWRAPEVPGPGRENCARMKPRHPEFR